MKKGSGVIWVAIGVVVVAFLAMVVYFVNNKHDVNYNDYNLNALIEGDEDNGGIADHVKGNAEAPVLIYEYADYQCPGCASMNPRINTLLTEYGEQLGLVYRNYLLSYHQNGTAAATAAEAAAMQGYFKEYGDMLFANQSTWESASVDERGEMFVDLFRKVSNGAGDEGKFRTDMESSSIKKKLKFDQGAGDKMGVTGTPAFYLNGEKIDFSEAKTEDAFYELMRQKIDAALKEKGVEPVHNGVESSTASDTESSDGASATAETGETSEGGE